MQRVRLQEALWKMSMWRLLSLETHNAFMNMAIDEAILITRLANDVPNTLRFYRWKPSAVSIGKNQKPSDQVNVEACKRIGVDVVRRISGGGTVYHDEFGEITYSLTVKNNSVNVADITTVYAKVYQAISEALRIVGITSDYNLGNQKNCPNLTVNNKKISGSAQTHKRDTTLQHGTILLTVDLPRMFSVLRVPWAKSRNQVINIAKSKISSIKDELGHPVSGETMCNVLTEGFRNTFCVEILNGELTIREQKLAQKLCREKYNTTDWNLHGKASTFSASI